MRLVMSSETISGRAKDMVPLPDNFVPGPEHVICAKGKEVKEHPANRLLRSLVKAHLHEYNECPSKLERSFIVSKILKTVQQDGKGGFVRKIDDKWYDIGPRNSKEKIGQTFRDSLHTKYRSSTKAKASFRKRLHMSDDSLSSGNDEKIKASPPQKVNAAANFPISEVSFDMSAVQPDISKSVTDVDWRDLEPLPLSHDMLFRSAGVGTPSSEAPSNRSSMTEAHSQMSCTVLSSSTAPTLDASHFETMLQQSAIHNRASEQTHRLLAGLQASAMSAASIMMGIPDPDPIREPRPGPVSSMAFVDITFVNTQPRASPLVQDQYATASAMSPSMFPNTNTSAYTLANSNPSFATSLQQQQWPSPQHQLQQQQNQQQSIDRTISGAMANEYQAFLKSQEGNWKRQFE